MILYASLPTIYGEKLVLRILDQAEGILSLQSCGWGRQSSRRKIIDVTHMALSDHGPTGSGKTTTLYAMLSFLNSERNIVTLEEPVEYSLAGINQVQVNPV